MKPRALDLFCGAGAVSDGLTAAGFHTVGVDNVWQPRYPYPFYQEDALDVLGGLLDGRYEAQDPWWTPHLIWASPPCQRFTALSHAPGAKGDENPDLIAPTRELLKAIEKKHPNILWVIENVENAPLNNPVMLCGSAFALGTPAKNIHGRTRWFQLQRHRIFEANFPIPPVECAHTQPVIGLYGGHVRCRDEEDGWRGKAGGRDFEGQDRKAIALGAMGIERFQTMTELSEAIPPAYALHVANAAIRHLHRNRIDVV